MGERVFDGGERLKEEDMEGEGAWEIDSEMERVERGVAEGEGVEEGTGVAVTEKEPRLAELEGDSEG